MDTTRDTCQTENIAAYVDGELTGATLARFEQHVKDCGDCATELRIQRQLLCTLDVAFNDARSFDLPANFTRVVTVRAENDLRTIRHGQERKRALQLCAALAIVSFGLLGAATRAVVFDPLRSFLRTARVLFDLIWHAAADAGAAAIVVVRMLARGVLQSQSGARFVLMLALLASLLCLSLLIAKYRRAEIIE